MIDSWSMESSGVAKRFAFDMMCVNSRSNVPSVEVNVRCIDNISHNEFLLRENIYYRIKDLVRICYVKISYLT